MGMSEREEKGLFEPSTAAQPLKEPPALRSRLETVACILADPNAPRSRESCLVWRCRDGAVHHHPLAAPVMIGRSPECDIVLDDPRVSRRHCRVSRDLRGLWVLEDLSARNRTRVNGTAVNRAELHEGDLLELGHAEIVFLG